MRGLSTALVIASTAPLTIAEPLIVENGILSAGPGGHSFSGTISGTGTQATLHGMDDSAFALTGIISGASGWKVDAGTVTLGGPAANTFTGPLTADSGTAVLAKPAGISALAGPLNAGTGNAGTIRLAAANQIPNATAVTLNGLAAVLDTAGFADTIASLTMTGGTVQIAAGTLTLTGVVTTLASGIFFTVKVQHDQSALSVN